MDTAVSDREAMLPVRRQYETDVLKLEKWNKAATTLCEAPLELEASIQELQLELKKHQVRIYYLFVVSIQQLYSVTEVDFLIYLCLIRI